MNIDADLLAHLRCPIDGAALVLSADGKYLVNTQAGRYYPIDSGILMLLPENAQSAPVVPEKQGNDE